MLWLQCTNPIINWETLSLIVLNKVKALSAKSFLKEAGNKLIYVYNTVKDNYTQELPLYY